MTWVVINYTVSTNMAHTRGHDCVLLIYNSCVSYETDKARAETRFFVLFLFSRVSLLPLLLRSVIAATFFTFFSSFVVGHS